MGSLRDKGIHVEGQVRVASSSSRASSLSPKTQAQHAAEQARTMNIRDIIALHQFAWPTRMSTSSGMTTFELARFACPGCQFKHDDW